MTKDQELYSRIGQCLFDATAEDSTKICLTATMSENDDYVHWNAYALDKSGKDFEIDLDILIAADMSDDIMKLHHYYVENLKSNWRKFVMEIELPDGQMKIDFSYPELG